MEHAWKYLERQGLKYREISHELELVYEGPLFRNFSWRSALCQKDGLIDATDLIAGSLIEKRSGFISLIDQKAQ